MYWKLSKARQANSEKDNMDLSVIIVNYNTRAMTVDCLDSVFANTRGVDFEVIVVDNASTDDSVEVLSRDNRITLVCSDENLGFGKANNLGYSRSKGRNILLLNSDTIVRNNALKMMSDALDAADPRVGCLGAIMFGPDGKTPTSSFCRFPSIRSTLRFFASYYLRISEKPYAPSPEGDVDYITGADLMIRRSLVEDEGLFDPHFFMYFEESEMQLRYARAGYRRVVIQGPDIVHLEGASFGETRRLNGNRGRMYFESMRLYMRKRYSLPKFVLFQIISTGYIPLLMKNAQGFADFKSMFRALFLPVKR